MEYYMMEGLERKVVLVAVEGYDDTSDCWLCKYFIDKENNTIEMWKSLSASHWNIIFELTEKDFNEAYERVRHVRYLVQSF